MNTGESRIESQDLELSAFERFGHEIRLPADAVDGDLLDGINSSPMGRLLKLISTLPEVRQEKVVAIRRQLDRGQYGEGEEFDEVLDEALDRVLEEFLAES